MDAKAVIECLDYTLLDFEASEAELEEFVSRANSSEVGAICVFSEHASFVKERLDERIKLAVVAAGFPIGSSNLDEIRKAIQAKGLPNLAVPRKLEVLKEIPVLGTGKINHRELEAQLADLD